MPQMIDWNVLKPAVQNKRCVLFLGPDAYPFDTDKTVEAALWQIVAADTSLVRYFYRDDGLVLFEKKSNRGKFLETVQHFFDDPAKDWALTRLQLEKLVCLPFLAIVNLTLDDLLPRHFRETGLECQSVHYIFRPSLTEKPISDLPLDGEKPLVLNLLGSIRSSDNVVLTHNDLFDFLRSLFDDKDQWLQELLHEADCFLFVGVPFEKWYLQLLLQKLSKYQKPSDEAERYALPENKAITMQELYSHELKIQFVEEAQQDVIEELYRFCEEKNLLHRPKTPLRAYKNESLQAIHRHLLRGEVEEAITAFLAFASGNNELGDELTLLSVQYQNWKDNRDTLTAAENVIERNKIVKAILYWLAQSDN